MPWSRKLECPDCGNVWTVLLMKRTDRNPPCGVCAAKPVETLAAPSLNRGAAPSTSMKIPENKTKAIDLAMRVASEDNGGANFNTKSRPGEAVALPIPAGQEPMWGGQGNGKIKMPLDFGSAAVAASADGYRARNSGILDAMADRRQDKLKPVYRQGKSA